jgi:hypothetical protein
MFQSWSQVCVLVLKFPLGDNRVPGRVLLVGPARVVTKPIVAGKGLSTVRDVQQAVIVGAACGSVVVYYLGQKIWRVLGLAKLGQGKQAH